jgi:hypothetical protein
MRGCCLPRRLACLAVDSEAGHVGALANTEAHYWGEGGTKHDSEARVSKVRTDPFPPFFPSRASPFRLLFKKTSRVALRFSC